MTRRRLERLPPELEHLRQVAIEHPDDLHAHLVFADALLERGDPLGTFIVQQSQDRRAPLPEDIARRLTGSLCDAASYFWVRLGILRGLGLQHVSPSHVRRFIGHPVLASIDWVDLRRWPTANPLPGDAVAEFLVHPVMRRLKVVEGLSFDALRHLAPHSLTLDSIVVVDRRGPVVHESARPMRLRAGRIHFTTADDDPWVVSLLSGSGRWALELCTEASFVTPAYEAFELMRVAPPSLQRISVTAAFVERAEDRWHLRLRPLDRGCCYGWTNSPGELLAACEQMLEDFQEFFSLVIIEGGDLGPDVAEQLQRMAPNVPIRFDWSGPPPYDFRRAAEIVF